MRRGKTTKYRTFIKLLKDYLILGEPWQIKGGKFIARSDRGMTMFNFIWKPLTIVGIGGVLFGIEIHLPPIFLGILFFGWIGFIYTVGFLDITFGFFKKQLSYISGQIDPVQSEIRRNTRKIIKNQREEEKWETVYEDTQGFKI